MRTVSQYITELWDQGGPFVGVDRSHGRVTVEPDWTLHLLSSGITAERPSQLPYRWFQDINGGQVEVEVPGVQTISWNRSRKADAASCTIVLSNMLITQADVQAGSVGKRGALTWNYGHDDAAARWGQAPNSWENVLIQNGLLRTYEGWGGYEEDGTPMSIPDAVAAGYLYLTGVWLIDDARMTADGLITVECRDMAKLLIEQTIFPPFSPPAWYPIAFSRWKDTEHFNPAVPVYDSCVDSATEVLTDRGWLRGWELTEQDRVASMDLDRRMRWSAVRSIYRNPCYSGKMHRLVGRQMDALVTPGHKFAVMKEGSDVVRITAVEDLRRHDRIATMGVVPLDEGPTVYSDAFVEIVGWALTEGYYRPSTRPGWEVNISQSQQSPHLERIVAALKAAGPGWRRDTASGGDGWDFCLSGELAREVRRVAPDKRLTYEFIRALSPSQLRLLQNVLMWGDGTATGSLWATAYDVHDPDPPAATFSQQDVARTDAFQAVAALNACGTRKAWSTAAAIHRVPIKHERVQVVRNLREHVEVDVTDEYVWCPATEFGTFVCRRNGMVYVTGNSDPVESGPGAEGPKHITDIAMSADGEGYWLVGTDGGVFCQPVGTMVRVPLPADITRCGTYASYTAGCRCPACRAAALEYERLRASGVAAARKGPKPTEWTEVPIEDLRSGDRVVSMDEKTRVLHRRGNRISRISRFHHEGPLVCVEAQGHTSRYTPDHHCLVMLGSFFTTQTVVYLMRRGNQYRIGMSGIVSTKQGPWARCLGEGADAYWVLSTHETRTEALLAEALAGHEFNIPTLAFRAKGNALGPVDIDVFWEKVGDNSDAAARCLAAYGRLLGRPLWERSRGLQQETHSPFVTAAANLMPGMLVLPADNTVQDKRMLRYRDHSWKPAKVWREFYSGDIVSLEVESDHTYIGDGLVTHNSLGVPFYGSRGGAADVDPAPMVSIAADPLNHGYWLCTADGDVYTFGQVDFWGNAPVGAAGTIVAIVPHPRGRGYWMLGDDGTVYEFGDAAHFGDNPATAQPIVDMAATHTGLGYWLLADDGAIFTYGDAPFHGSASIGFDLATGLAPHPGSTGYYIATILGEVYPQGDATEKPPNGDWVASQAALNDPISSITATPTGNGYLLVGGDGGVFSFGDAPFWGSLPEGFTYITRTDGSYRDLTDVVKAILLWSGFLAYGAGDDSVYGVMEPTGTYLEEPIPIDTFDRASPMDAINEMRKIVNFDFHIDEEGAVHWRPHNFYAYGNYMDTGEHVETLVEIDERNNLTDYAVSRPDAAVRSQIVISSSDPTAALDDVVTTRRTLRSGAYGGLDLVRGMVRPLLWVNEHFNNAADQQTLIRRIVDLITFSLRRGTVRCWANPRLQVGDQIRVWEETTAETFVHHIEGISSNHDLSTGSWVFDLQTGWLGEDWSVDDE